MVIVICLQRKKHTYGLGGANAPEPIIIVVAVAVAAAAGFVVLPAGDGGGGGRSCLQGNFSNVFVAIRNKRNKPTGSGVQCPRARHRRCCLWATGAGNGQRVMAWSAWWCVVL
jgi:hypothetical protein